MHELLPDGSIIHIVPRMAGAKSDGLFQVVLGAVAIGASFLTGGTTLALWGSALSAGAISASSVLFSMGMAMKSPRPGRPITANRTRFFVTGQRTVNMLPNTEDKHSTGRNVGR